MHRSHRATRKWLKNHKSPEKVQNLILSLKLPEAEEELLIRHYLKSESIDFIACSLKKCVSYETAVSMHKKALRKLDYARKKFYKNNDKESLNLYKTEPS